METNMANNDSTKVKQNLSLITALRAGNEWLSEDMRVLANLKDEGKSIAEIAEILGRTYYSVATKLQATGMVAARQSTRKPKATQPACAACFVIHNGECY
jgi:predicted transcriptional regulator